MRFIQGFSHETTQLLQRIYQHRGIRVRRDSWVSVMYSTELNSATSSVTLQRTDRHGILGEKPSDFQLFS
jgi:hypothetical protein